MIETLDEAGFNLIIYTLSCPATGEIRYVGQTNNIKQRFYKHITASKQPKRHSECWIAFLTKKGLKPVIEVLDTCTKYEVDTIEKMYISLFRGWGFNLTNIQEGGQLNRGMSAETKLKLRKANLGKKQSVETRQKRSDTSRATWSNPELRDLKSRQTKELNRLGIIGTKGMITKKRGVPVPDDVKIKITESLKRYYSVNPNKRLFEPANKEQFISDYANMSETVANMAKRYNMSKTTIVAYMRRNNIQTRKQ